MREKPLVSIFCLAYNHEEYIHNALDGFMNQETGYPVEIIIHDDASLDKTTDIMKMYDYENPGIFTMIYEDENQYSKGENANLPLKFCKGKYIALCEGDDFWIDTKHIERSVNYMERHPECLMTVCNGWRIDYDNRFFSKYHIETKERNLDAEDIILEKYGGFPTASMVMRKEAFYPIDSFYGKAGIGDWTKRLYVLEQGRTIHYFNKCVCIYRYKFPGSWNVRTYGDFSRAFFHTWELCQMLNKYDNATCGKYREVIQARSDKQVARLIQLSGCNDLSNLKKRINEECNKTFIAENKDYVDHVFDYMVGGMTAGYPVCKECIYDNEQKLIETLKKFKKIYLYGAGVVGKLLEKKLSQYDIDISGYCVSNKDNASEEKGIFCYSTMNSKEKTGAIFVVSVTRTFRGEIVNILKSDGCHDMAIMSDDLINHLGVKS